MTLRFGVGKARLEAAPDLAAFADGSCPGLTPASVLAYLPFARESLCIYFSGSHALGWNHHRSDLDLYIITSSPVHVDETLGDVFSADVGVEPATVPLLLGTFGPYRSDVEFWLENQVDQILDRVASADDGSPISGLTSGERDFVHKLSIGKALTGEAWLSMRQQRVADACVGRALARESKEYAHSALEDTEGFLSAGDHAAALLAVREGFDHTIDAILFSHDQLSGQRKWRARQLEHIAPELIDYDEYWGIETMRDYDPSNPRPWILATARRCHDLLVGLAVRLA